jgi:tRNA (cmo5U34)-methyltransferase
MVFDAAPTSFDIPTNWTFADDSVAEAFERHVREQLPWYELATGAVAHVGRHYIPENGVVYDLGASTGNIGRALAPTISARHGDLIAIESSAQMARRWVTPDCDCDLVITDVREVEWQPFDLAVSFLTMMFVPIGARRELVETLLRYRRPGGAIIVVDKSEATTGYAATVMWRLALAGKVAAGVPAGDIVAKELSLGGVQRPIDPALLGPSALEFFRFGDFAGWLLA